MSETFDFRSGQSSLKCRTSPLDFSGRDGSSGTFGIYLALFGSVREL